MTGDDRGAGFIDFAIGPYAKPEIAIEFCLKYGWPDEAVTYDFLKVLDARNPFGAGFSHTVILRDNNLTTGANRHDLQNHINSALHKAIERLSGIGGAPTAVTFACSSQRSRPTNAHTGITIRQREASWKA